MIKQLPSFEYKEYFAKKSHIALLIPTWNEGERIQKELQRIKDNNINSKVDIFLLDGETTDGSLNEKFVTSMGNSWDINYFYKRTRICLSCRIFKSY